MSVMVSSSSHRNAVYCNSKRTYHVGLLIWGLEVHDGSSLHAIRENKQFRNGVHSPCEVLLVSRTR